MAGAAAMKGGGGSDTTTTTVPEWVRPYAEGFMQRSQQVADMPYQPFTGATQAQLNPYQTSALDSIAQRAVQGSPVNNAASSELTKTISGGYLGSNPYLDSVVDRAQGDVVRNYNLATKPAIESAMVRSGSFGNSGLQQMQSESQRQLQDTLGNISSGIRGNDYAAERGRMTSAIGMAPQIASQDYVDANALLGAGGQYQQQEQANLSDNYNRFLEARNYPREQLGVMGQGLGFNFGSSTTGPEPNKKAGMLGGAMTGASIGSVAGPYGALAGGVGGAAMGGK